MAGTKTEIRPGVWKLRVFSGKRTDAGSPVQITRTLDLGDGKPGSGVRKADAELAKMLAKVGGGQTATGAQTVNGLLADYIQHCEDRDRAPTTIREYRRIADKTISPAIGSMRLSKLDAEDLDRLYSSLRRKGNSPATVRRVHSLMNAALRQGRKWKRVNENVAVDATVPEANAKPVQAPTPVEVRAVVTAAEGQDPTLAYLFLLAALTGARRGELCGLKWSDVDAEARTLTIERSVYETKGGQGIKDTKNHQARRIGLDDLALDTLRRHRASVDQLARSLDLPIAHDAFIFSRSPQGLAPLRPDDVTRGMTAAAKAAKVKTHLHAFRHFAATQSIAGGFDVTTVAGRLGHKDASVTLRVYSHVLEQRDHDLADALGKTLALPAVST
jgi:integrase